MEIETTVTGGEAAEATSTPADGSEQPIVQQDSAGEGVKQDETAKAGEAEKAKAAKAEEEKERVRASRLADQLKREQKFRNERLAWEKERDAGRKQLEEERASFKAQVEKLQATRGTLDKFVKELRDNPIQVLQEYFGIGPEQYYHRVINNGKPDPNELTSRQLAELKQQLEEERNWRTGQEKAAKEREEAAKKQQEEQAKLEAAKQADARKQAAQKQFFDFVKGNESKYSDLLIYPNEVILSQAENLIAHIQETEGDEVVQNMTYEDLAGRLNDGLAAWHAKVKGTAASATAVAPASKEETPAPTANAAGTDDEELSAAVSRKAESKKTEKVRRGNVRTATTLSGEMATRTTAKTKTTDYEEAKRRLVQELEAR